MATAAWVSDNFDGVDLIDWADGAMAVDEDDPLRSTPLFRVGNLETGLAVRGCCDTERLYSGLRVCWAAEAARLSVACPARSSSSSRP
jgi:hypothetical protein